MKKAVIFFIVILPAFLVTCTLNSNAQSGILRWKYALTANSASVSQMMSDSVGNVYVIGTFYRDQFKYESRSVRGNQDLQNVFVLKAEPTGKPIFLYSIMSETPGGEISPGKANINEKGELAFAFYTEGSDKFQMGKYIGTGVIDETNVYLAKISKTGIISWVHFLENDMDTLPETKINDLFIDEEGSVIFTGYFRGFSLSINKEDKSIPGTDHDAMLLLGRVDRNGAVPWLVNCPYNTSMDDGEIRGTHLCKTSADFFYLAGYHERYRPYYFGSGPDSIYNAWGTDAFVAQYMMDGNSNWVRSFRGDSLDYIEKLAVTRENEVVVLGMSNSIILDVSGNIYENLNGNYDLFIARYSTAGVYMKSTNITTQMGYRKDYDDNAFLKVNDDDNILVCSEFNGNEVFEDAYKLVNAENGTRDLMFARIDGNTMQPLWTNQGTAPGNNTYDDVFFDRNGNTFIGGTTFNLLDIDGQLIEGDNKDGSPYLVKIHPTGEMDYSYWQPNSTDYHISIAKVASDNYGNSYVAGTFSGTSPVLDDQPLVGPETTGFFLAKYSWMKDIEGNVIDQEGNPVTQGYVKIYGRTLFQRSPVVDSVELSSGGEFIFKDVPFGEFILVATPAERSDQNVVTTYFPQAEYWELAEQIKVDAYSGPHNYTIEMLPVPVFQGGTFLDGGVTELDSTDLSKTSAKGRPKQKASVVLVGNKSHKSTWEIVAVIETDEEGNFSFSGIEDGSYILYVDYPGLPVEDAYAIEIAGHEYVSSLDYLVDEEKISAHGLPVYSFISETGENPDINIFPNPASDHIDIILKSDQKMIIDLFDVNGKLVNHHVSDNPAKLILTNQPSGTYFLRIMTEESIYFEKITIK
jgi:hypothetical protein